MPTDSRLRLRTALLALALGVTSAGSDARIWKTVRGFEGEADLVSHDESEVKLRLKSGRDITLRIDQLSAEDREFLKKHAAGKPPGGPPGTAGSEADDLNWNVPWPATVVYKEDPEIRIAEENNEEKKWVYESSHYRFTCDVRLSKSVVSNFAEMFESAYQFSRALPLAVTGGRTNDGKFDILLFEEFDDYVKAGGPPSSSGVFMPRENIVMVPLKSLGVRKVGSGYMRDRDKSDQVLVHELVHQLTPDSYFRKGSRGWFTEGIAEYCAMTPYSNGRFGVRNTLDNVRESVTGYNKKTNRGRALGTEIRAMDLKKFMTMAYADFTGTDSNANYGMAALITTYFIHLDGEGDAARLKAFLRKAREDTDIEVAFAALLDGRTWDQLEADISKGWGRKRVKIEFD